MNKTFTKSIEVTVPGPGVELMRAINLALVGNVNCNVRGKGGELVLRPGVSEEVAKRLEAAHFAANRNNRVKLSCTYDVTTGEMVGIAVDNKF